MFHRRVSLFLFAAVLVGCNSNPTAPDQAAPTDAKPDPEAAKSPAPAVGTPNPAGGVTGDWVIDLQRSAQPMAKLPPEILKEAKKSHMDLASDGTFKQSMMGMEMTGTYELTGAKLKMKAKGFDNTQEGDYSAKDGTITFSPGPKRIVFVRGK